MVGRFLLGMVSGGLVVTGGLVVGSMLFPTGTANDNRAVASVEAPIKAPEATVADAGAAVEVPEEPAATPEPVPEPEAEPEPAAAAEPEPVPTKPEPTEPEPTEPEPEVLASEPAAKPAVTDTLPAALTPEPVTGEDVIPAASKVAAPETAAEPSKPAEAMADIAAPAPEPVPEPKPAAEHAAPETATEPPMPETEVATPATVETATAEPVAPEAKPATDTATPVTEPATAAPAENAPTANEVAEVEPESVPQTESEPEPLPDPAPALETPAEPMPEIDVAEAAPEAAAPEMPGAKPEPLPEVAEVEVAPDAGLTEGGSSSTFKPAPGLTRAGEGLIIGRGNAPAASDPAATPPAATDPAATDPGAAPADAGALPADTRPIAAFATKFENTDAKPPFAIVLIDDGRADLDRAGLAALPVPASIALDPLDPATPERAAAYRAAGKEVVMLVTGIADGAQASDVEVAFQSMAQGLPEAVAVMDLADPAFQNNRGLASAVVPILKAQGRGLLTWDAGLNAADQVARREDLEAATIFRDIGEAGADSAGVRRLLDRAVFKAGQDGRVAVVGTADPATLAALLEWTVEGKAATVALAPLTAVLKVD